jgi:tetratricopeptide (TPR) repeat protein
VIKLLISTCILLNASVQTAPTATQTSRQLYEQASQAIATADPRAAVLPLEQLLADQSTSSLATIAAVHLAECYIAVDRTADAIDLLEKWSDRIAESSKSTKLDTDLDAHHLRVWLQAARRVSDDRAAIESLENLARRLDSRSDKTDLTETITGTSLELTRRLAACGRFQEAAVHLGRLSDLERSSASAEVQLLHAILFQQLGDHAQARKLLQSLVASESTTLSHSLARLELASYALQDRDFETAAAHLKPIIDAHASTSEAGDAMFDVELDCRFRLLWSELELAQGHAARSLEVLPTPEQIAALDESRQIAVRFGRAEAAAQAGQHVAALEELRWLSNLARQASAPPEWASTVMLRRCELLLKTKDYSHLAASVAEAKTQFPTFKGLHEFDYLLARAAMLQIDFEQARLHLRAIIDSPATQTSPAAARAQWMLGETYFLEQDFGAAITAYQSVTERVEQQPWQTLALMQTAKCHELLNQANEALAAYQRVVAHTGDEKIRQEASARIEVLGRTALRPKPRPLR